MRLVSVRSYWPDESTDMQYDPFRSSNNNNAAALLQQQQQQQQPFIEMMMMNSGWLAMMQRLKAYDWAPSPSDYTVTKLSWPLALSLQHLAVGCPSARSLHKPVCWYDNFLKMVCYPPRWCGVHVFSIYECIVFLVGGEVGKVSIQFVGYGLEKCVSLLCCSGQCRVKCSAVSRPCPHWQFGWGTFWNWKRCELRVELPRRNCVKFISYFWSVAKVVRRTFCSHPGCNFFFKFV